MIINCAEYSADHLEVTLDVTDKVTLEVVEVSHSNAMVCLDADGARRLSDELLRLANKIEGKCE